MDGGYGVSGNISNGAYVACDVACRQMATLSGDAVMVLVVMVMVMVEAQLWQ